MKDIVLLTGCAGFIGARTTELLLDKGYKVVGIDNLNDYYDVSLKKFRLKSLKTKTDFIFHKIDLEDFSSLNKLFGKYKFKAVINLAARAGVRYSIVHPRVYFSTNVQGTLNLLELMKEFKVTKFVIASTSSLYAGLKTPFRESMDVSMPISPYAASKKAAEVLAYTYHSLYDIDVSVLRYFTVYGPAGRPDMGYFCFIKAIDEGKVVHVFGDGEQRRDMTYIDDIAMGTILALKKVGYEIINLGAGKPPITVKELIEKIEKLLGKKAKVKYCKTDKTDMEATRANIDKAKRILDWQPKTDIDTGLRLVIDWYLVHKYRALKSYK